MTTVHVDHTHEADNLSHLDEAHGVEKRGDRKIERLSTRQSGDSLGKAKQDHSQAYEASEEEGARPTLSAPDEAARSYWGFGDPDTGDSGYVPLIAVIAKTMALQMEANSSFWSNSFKLASQEMDTFYGQIDQAVLSTKDAFKHMSEATRKEAEIDEKMGTSAVIGGVTAFFMGGGQGVEAAGKEIAKKTGMNAVAKNTLAGAKSVAASGGGQAAAGAGYGAGRQLLTYVSKVSYKFSIANTAINATSQGITQLSYTNKLKGAEADEQLKQGDAQGDQKKAEMESQYHEMAYQRTDGFRQSTQQFIDLAYNLMISAADSLAQATQRLYQG